MQPGQRTRHLVGQRSVHLAVHGLGLVLFLPFLFLPSSLQVDSVLRFPTPGTKTIIPLGGSCAAADVAAASTTNRTDTTAAADQRVAIASFSES
jgi:hypothetical protein